MRRRILIVIPQLVAGGSEKVLTTIARNLNRELFEIHIAVLGRGSADSDLSAPPHIGLHELKARHVRYAGFGLLRLVWKLRPNAVIAAGGPSGVLAAVVAKFAPRCMRLIVRQGTMPATAAPQLKSWARWAYRWSQHQADQLVCQSEAMVQEVVNAAAVKSERIRLLYNPVDLPQPTKFNDSSEVSSPRFLVVSRLSTEKRLDLVIRAFAILKHERVNATLTILGDGPCRGSLEALACREASDGSVSFLGYQPNPLDWMSRSQALVIASEFEGLPNAVLEALSV